MNADKFFGCEMIMPETVFYLKGKKGQHVWTDGNDEAHLSKGVYNTYTNRNLRYSQVAPLDMFTEKKYFNIYISFKSASQLDYRL